MDYPQQREVLFQGNPFYAADEPRNAAAFHPPQYPQPALFFDRDRRPLLGQPHGHGGVLRDAVFRPNEERENMSPPVENIPAQAQPQDVQHIDVGHYDMANDYPQPQGYGPGYPGDNARYFRDVRNHVPAQAYVAPPLAAPEIGAFNGEVLQAGVGAAPAFLGELPHQVPVHNGRVAEDLWQLAIQYLHDPNSQVVGIRREPGQADGEVVITLRSTGLPYNRFF